MLSSGRPGGGFAAPSAGAPAVRESMPNSPQVGAQDAARPRDTPAWLPAGGYAAEGQSAGGALGQGAGRGGHEEAGAGARGGTEHGAERARLRKPPSLPTGPGI